MGLPLLYLLFSDLNCHCESMYRFGEDDRVLLKLARRIDPVKEVVNRIE